MLVLHKLIYKFNVIQMPSGFSFFPIRPILKLLCKKQGRQENCKEQWGALALSDIKLVHRVLIKIVR